MAVALVAVVAVVAGSTALVRLVDRWPPHPDLDAYARTIDKGVKNWVLDPRDKTVYRQPYDPAGDYLGFSTLTWDEKVNRTFDDAGLPMMKYNKAFEYNPITIAQFALSAHGTGDEARFLQAARFLRDNLEGEDGAFRFDYRYRHYLGVLEPGWTSAMAQGEALSVFSRAYRLDKDQRWLTAGSRALTFLLSEKNGLMPSLAPLDKTLADHRFFSEWPITPADFTLNGGMFTMLGLYDWTTLGLEDVSGKQAAAAWHESLETLVALLPYYDMGRITAYDLTYLTYPHREPHIVPKYHGVHGYLLYALVGITGDPRLKAWLDRWDAYL